MRFSAGEGIYLDVLEAERFDFASRRALGGGWEISAQADHDCRGANGTPKLRVAK